jgi:hypothetical protein
MLTRISDNPIWNQGQKESSRDIVWNTSVEREDEFAFGGFNQTDPELKASSLKTRNPIDFGEFLKINFLLLIKPNIANGAAIIDLDLALNGNSKDFFSMIVDNNELHTTVRNGDIRSTFTIKQPLHEWSWIDIQLRKKHITVNLPNKTSYYFKFDREMNVSYVSFGNNERYDGLDLTKHDNFSVKDIQIETEYFKLK